jgi:hypothetical protein
MSLWRNVRLYVCVFLVLALAYVGYTRGFGWRLGGPPAAIRGAYQTEEAWIVGAIVGDILEMSRYRPGQPNQRSDATPPKTVSPGIYRVAAGTVSVDVDVKRDPWAAESFAAIARAAMAESPASADVPSSLEEMHPALLELTPAALVNANRIVSQALSNNMRDATAHEAAALILGAFSLRESAGRFSDVRWGLNRMTAHLAMAAVLRGSAEPSVDGMLAVAVRLALANHQAQALQRVEQLRQHSESPSILAWTRVVELRVTEDWRRLSSPETASLLERQEYFRARRETVSNASAQTELASLHADDSVEWLRIMEGSPLPVSDGRVVAESGLAAERAEAAAVFEAMNGRPLPDDATSELNLRASGCITEAGPQVLPWSAWAEFFQRHLARLIGNIDNFYRHRLGDVTGAEAAKRGLDDQLGGLALFPAATAFRTRGKKGSEADLTHIRKAIDFAARAPERVTAQAWAFLETSARYEAVAHGMPLAAKWFMKPTAYRPFDAASRVDRVTPRPGMNDLAAVLEAAPHDFALSWGYLKRRYLDAAPYAEVQRVFGARLEYDMRTLTLAKERLEHDMATLTLADERRNVAKEQEALMRGGCAVYIGECSALAALFVRQDRDDEAAAEYERVFSDPSFDAVGMANQSGWLVNYYFEHGKTFAAKALADRSAQVGSYRGMVTAGHLYERLERWSEAEKLYQQAAARYQNDSDLIAFYYRAVNTHKQAQFETARNESVGRIFPGGLRPAAPATMSAPERGVIVTKDNALSRKAGLQAGDIVVGLEGWQVESLPQYRAVNAFVDRDEMKLSVWRGKTFDVTLSAPNRSIGIEFRTYPIEGWAE